MTFFSCSPKGEHIVIVLSVRPSDRSSVTLCPEHISKSIEGNLIKLDTLIEGHEGNCRMQNAKKKKKKKKIITLSGANL